MIENFAESLLSSNLLEQATEVLKQRLAECPQDGSTLAQLGDLCRKQGKLAEAAETYSRLTRLIPDDERAKYLQALLAGSVPSAWPPDEKFQPAPFVLIRHYLPPELHRMLLPLVLSAQAEFTPSLVGTDTAEIRPKLSHSLTLHQTGELYAHLCEQVTTSLPEVIPALQVTSFTPEHIEVEVKAYRQGHYFRTHHDHAPGLKRLINFGFFFHRQPKPYTGGDFLLFDTNFKNDNYLPTAFTRIVPEDNMIVFYLSAYYHAVTPVQCPNAEFQDSRFAIVGHIQATEVP